ncbi:MAG: paraquat-inducible protein A [Tannerella sp.]|jgi:uncharacterized paraquat-inducible protein A|nr:paraquat-inducible protein A [Tannerella sp.]
MKSRKIISIITLALSILFFAMGVYFPLLSTKQQVLGVVLKYREVNLFDSIILFFGDREYLLAGIILIFTFLFPVLKYIELIIRTVLNKTNNVLQHLDKWNMLDVFLVALLLLNFKMNSSIIVMQLMAGTTFIALAVIFRILTISLLTNKSIEK